MRNPTIPLAAAIALLLTACGGGGGGGSTAATPPAAMTLATATPANGTATGIDAAPALTFDAAPDMSTVTAKSVTLSSPIGTVDSRLALNGKTVTVTPASPLAWGSHYQLTVSDTLRSSAGGKLSAASTIGFDTRMAVWSAATKVGAPASNSTPVYYATTGNALNGDAVAVWTQTTSSSSQHLLAMRYTAATESWSAPATVQGASQLPTADWRYDLGVNGAGNACAAWAEVQANGDYIIKAARLGATAGWAAPVSLSKAGHYNYGGSPRVAISENGNIVVAWQQDTDTESIIYAAYYDAASQQWAPARALSSGATYADFPAVAVSANGTAMVLWSEVGLTPQVMLVHAARYDAAAKSWSPAINVQGNTTEISYASRVTFDANGNVFAIWVKDLSADNSGVAGAGAARYNAATGVWGKAVSLPFPPVYHPQIGVDSAGNALLVWAGYGSDDTYTFESARYQQSTDTWLSLPSQKLEVPITQVPRMDAAGNGLLAWVGHNGKFTMNAMRFNAGTGKWDAPQVVASDLGYMDSPVLTTDQSGQALLVWSQYIGDIITAAQVSYSRLSGR